jgi:hypothetical protein
MKTLDPLLMHNVVLYVHEKDLESDVDELAALTGATIF